MADQRITQLNELSKDGIASNDVLAIADISGSETKKVTAKNLIDAGIDLLASSSINLEKLNQEGSVTKIGASALADNSVSYTKIQEVTATDRLLGRSSAGSGNVEEISCTAAGRALLDDANAEAQRNTLELGAEDNVTFNSITGNLTSTSVAISGGSITNITDITIADGGTGASTAANARQNLGLQINQDIQAYDAGLQSISGLATGENQSIYLTASDTYAVYSLTAAGRALLDDADAAAQRITLGLGSLATQNGVFSGTHSGTSSGTNTGDQTITLTGAVTGAGTGSFATTLGVGVVLSGNIASNAVTYEKLQDTSATDVILGRSTAGGGTIEEISCTNAGRALLDDVNAAAQRDTLGLGDLATSTGSWTNGSSFSGTSSGTNTGDQTITLTGAVSGSGTESFATTLSDNIVAESNLQAGSVTTAKIGNSAIDENKLGDQSTCIISSSTPAGSGAFVGQGWFNSATSIAYRWAGTTWTQQAGIQSVTVTDSTPLSVAVNNPDEFTANITLNLDTQGANTVFAGPTSGSDAEPTFRALVAADLPDATSSAKGIIQPGTGLTVTSGTLNHSNTVTGATKSGITFDAQGHITAAVDLIAADIPDIDAAKIGSGQFATERIADNAITANKLGNKSTASIGETLPIAAFTGQLHFNPLDKNFFLWDGNVWQSLGISAGSIILAGTYDAAQNQIGALTDEGVALGLSAGGAIPAASSSNTNYYFVVSELGTGTGNAPNVALAPPDLILSTGTTWLEIDVSSTYTAQTAANISFTPAENLGATTVQGALEEVSNECRNLNNMNAGSLAADRGGTGLTSYTKGDLIAASGSITLAKLAVGNNGYVLSANSSQTTGLEWIPSTSGTVTEVTVTAPLGVTSGTTTPALTVSAGTTSAAGVLQLTDGVASSSTTTAATPNGVKTAYDLANLAMPKAGGTFTGTVLIGNTGSFVFEGTTDNAFETSLVVADPTADQVITLPNSTGTLALTSQLDDGTF